MLTDEQKDAIGMALVPLYQQLERDVIADCARRLQKTGRLTETAEIMADALRAKGYAPAQIRREVMRAINADLSLQREIAENTRAHKQAVREAVKRLNAEAEAQSEHLWEKAGGMAFRGDLSAWQGGAKPVKDSAFSDMIAAMKKAAAGELKNLTKSLGFRLMDGSLAGARSIYTAEMNRALVKLTSGAFSWRQCVRDACREMGRSGLRTVDYDSGATRSLDTAAFNALRTSSARLSAEITMHNVETTETALVEVSSHWGAREGEGHANHAGWQGKIYSVHGATEKYPNLEEATGYPSDPLGLCGYNCRHTFYPYWEGISEPADFPAEPAPVEVNGREYTYYQATQEQRRREREIRAMKREANALEAAGEGGAAKELRSAIRGKALEYLKFSDEVGIRAKVERLGVGEPSPDNIFAAGYKPLTGHDFDANIDVDVPKDVRRCVDKASKRVTDDFPLLDDYLYAVGYGKNEPGNPATAEISFENGYVGQVIALNRDMWTSIKQMDAFVRNQSAQGGHIQARHADSIITHEYGHVLHHSCALKRAGYTGQGTISQRQIMRFIDEKDKIAAEVKVLLQNAGMTLDSERARDKDEELIAEAVSDYYSGRRTKAARLVVDYLKEMFK